MLYAGRWVANAVIINGWVNSRPRVFCPVLVSRRLMSIRTFFQDGRGDEDRRYQGTTTLAVSGDFEDLPSSTPQPHESQQLLGITEYGRLLGNCTRAQATYTASVLCTYF